jgi:hypothetical protein
LRSATPSVRRRLRVKANRTKRESGGRAGSRGRFMTPADFPLRDSTEGYTYAAKGWDLSFKAIFCRPVPNPNVTVRNRTALHAVCGRGERFKSHHSRRADGQANQGRHPNRRQHQRGQLGRPTARLVGSRDRHQHDDVHTLWHGPLQRSQLRDTHQPGL